MNKQITLIVDYRGHSYSSVIYKEANMDIPLLQKFFMEQGYELIVKKFPEINFRKIIMPDSTSSINQQKTEAYCIKAILKILS